MLPPLVSKLARFHLSIRGPLSRSVDQKRRTSSIEDEKEKLCRYYAHNSGSNPPAKRRPLRASFSPFVYATSVAARQQAPFNTINLYRSFITPWYRKGRVNPTFLYTSTRELEPTPLQTLSISSTPKARSL